MTKTFGPQTEIGKWVFHDKYAPNETFKEAMTRVANHLKDDEDHFNAFRTILYDQRFLPAGRVQAAVGAPRATTPYNCFVMGTIPDSMDGIMRVASEAAETMRLGGGVGYDFSTLRPRGTLIRSLDSKSSGPLAFMDVFDALCKCILSAGHRRGAQMGVLRIDHPDVEEFISAKCNHTTLSNFNISLGVTDEFMVAVRNDDNFDLVFEGRVYRTVKARALWDRVLRATWDWADPGVLFLDTINNKNNLYYCETIAATNPCGEQPLPPYGACLLGSINMTKYIITILDGFGFDYEQLWEDLPHIIRAQDNIVDRAIYPLSQQEEEAKSKRRMGIGITGLANILEVMGLPYGSPKAVAWTEFFMEEFANKCYMISSDLAKEKGSFPLYDEEMYLKSQFIQRLRVETQDAIRLNGIRNSHLLSVAPTGTISLAADNISSGLEPPYMIETSRKVLTYDGAKEWPVVDWAYSNYGVRGKTAGELTIDEHLAMLICVSKWVDSACSKTVNIGDDVTWDEFQSVYMKAWKGGASGCTTFRQKGERFGIFTEKKTEDQIVDGAACYVDPDTGIKTCE